MLFSTVAAIGREVCSEIFVILSLWLWDFRQNKMFFGALESNMPGKKRDTPNNEEL